MVTPVYTAIYVSESRTGDYLSLLHAPHGYANLYNHYRDATTAIGMTIRIIMAVMIIMTLKIMTMVLIINNMATMVRVRVRVTVTVVVITITTVV